MHTYKVQVRIAGKLLRVEIDAPGPREARLLAERLYGAGSVTGTPQRV